MDAGNIDAVIAAVCAAFIAVVNWLQGRSNGRSLENVVKENNHIPAELVKSFQDLPKEARASGEKFDQAMRDQTQRYDQALRDVSSQLREISALLNRLDERVTSSSRDEAGARKRQRDKPLAER